MERIEHRAASGGWQDVYQHRSQVLGCEMKVAVYLPPQDLPKPTVTWSMYSATALHSPPRWPNAAWSSAAAGRYGRNVYA